MTTGFEPLLELSVPHGRASTTVGVVSADSSRQPAALPVDGLLFLNRLQVHAPSPEVARVFTVKPGQSEAAYL